ncbi:MAG TPA: DnaJ C-terminal domain-containing protein [Casimicrobiaceae bacterium]
MKYKDYYAALGVARDAGADAIKTAYRKLARKFHPDVSTEKNAEERFKEIGEAYETLKDPEKRAAYDALGAHPQGEEFRPPPDWGRGYGGAANAAGAGAFDDIDLSDLFAGFAGGERARGRNEPAPGRDYEAAIRISFDAAFHGIELELDLGGAELDEKGVLRHVAHPVKLRIPRGVTDGQRLRVPGKGGEGRRGGPRGDLYLDIRVDDHPLYRVDGADIHVDLPLAPWEAALGTTVKLPTPAGAVELKVAAGAHAGQKLRLKGRGMARQGAAGDLYALVSIVMPTVIGEDERKLYAELAKLSGFNPRPQFGGT